MPTWCPECLFLAFSHFEGQLRPLKWMAIWGKLICYSCGYSLSIGTSILYRLVPQLTPLDFYFLRCGALTWTRWCAYEGGMKKKNFKIFLICPIFFGGIVFLRIDFAKKKTAFPRSPSELDGQKGWHLQKTKWGIFSFFFAFWLTRSYRKRFRQKKLRFDAALVR